MKTKLTRRVTANLYGGLPKTKFSGVVKSTQKGTPQSPGDEDYRILENDEVRALENDELRILE